MILGEGQIMSQVKAAQRAAQEAGTQGPVLEQLFKLALNCGKRVRTETDMAKRAVSVSSAAVEMARQILGPLNQRAIAVIGAGKMARICVKHLLSDEGSGPVVMVNRTGERVEEFLKNKLPNSHRLKTGLNFADRYHLVAASDLVIVSTSAPEYLLEADELKKHAAERQCLIVDISVPRNVDPEIANLEGYTLRDSDHLIELVNKNLAEREALVSDAERIIFESLGDFQGWQRSLLVAPTIRGLRRKIESIRAEHMKKSARPGDAVDSSQPDDLENVSRAIVNQILHHPTVQLKATSDYTMLKQQAETLRTLFNLDVLAEPASITQD
jgi:glutamyl-tRNA reductase